jgi:hypothetical protein
MICESSFVPIIIMIIHFHENSDEATLKILLVKPPLVDTSLLKETKPRVKLHLYSYMSWKLGQHFSSFYFIVSFPIAMMLQWRNQNGETFIDGKTQSRQSGNCLPH